MSTPHTLWASEPIYLDENVCMDVHANVEGVRLGQIHGAHRIFAQDLHLTSEKAEAIAMNLLEGARRAREVGA